MRFGLYVHSSGSTWFDDVARALSDTASTSLAEVQLSEVDGLYIGFFATSSLAQGLRKVKKKVRRDYAMKIITGGSRHFNCLVELDVEVSDAELVASADSESSLFDFVQGVVLRSLPLALGEFPKEDLALVHTAVSSVRMAHTPRW